jgi:tryptophanyl-tRNA synthetase
MADYHSLVEALERSLGRAPISLWGVAPIAPIHLGYDRLIVHQRALRNAGAHHIILLADLHAVLTRGLSFGDVARRSFYYEQYLARCCDLRVTYIRGSEFQTGTEYVDKLYALMNTARVSWIHEALPPALRDSGAAKFVFPMAYLLMQCLDAVHLQADLVLADRAQSKVYGLWRRLEPALPPNTSRAEVIGTHVPSRRARGWQPLLPRFEYVPLTHDIRGLPLNASTRETRISIHDDDETIDRKVRMMYAPPGEDLAEGKGNALLEHFEWSVFPWRAGPIAVERRGAETLEFDAYEDFERAYRLGEVHPGDCKPALFECVRDRVHTIRDQLAMAVTSWVDDRN